MRKLLLIFMALPIMGMAQKAIGLGFAFGVNNFLILDGSYYHNKDVFTLGYNAEMVFPKGKHESGTLSNYGKTERGDGIFDRLVEFGYGRLLTNKIILRGNINLGGRYAYQEFSDNRFNGGGYYLTDNIKTLFGGGADILYSINDHIMFTGGYNSIMSATFGMEFKF